MPVAVPAIASKISPHLQKMTPQRSLNLWAFGSSPYTHRALMKSQTVLGPPSSGLMMCGPPSSNDERRMAANAAILAFPTSSAKAAPVNTFPLCFLKKSCVASNAPVAIRSCSSVRKPSRGSLVLSSECTTFARSLVASGESPRVSTKTSESGARAAIATFSTSSRTRRNSAVSPVRTYASDAAATAHLPTLSTSLAPGPFADPPRLAASAAIDTASSVMTCGSAAGGAGAAAAPATTAAAGCAAAALNRRTSSIACMISCPSSRCSASSSVTPVCIAGGERSSFSAIVLSTIPTHARRIAACATSCPGV